MLDGALPAMIDEMLQRVQAPEKTALASAIRAT
jgi:hypothetical protein